MGSEMCIRDSLPMHQPTHPRRATAIQQYSSTCVDTNRVAVSYTGISIVLRFSAIPGSERSVPGRPTYNAPRSPSWARHPLFAGDKEGLLCEWDVAPQRGRGTPGGARDSQLFFGCVVTKIFSKIQMTTTTSQGNYTLYTCLLYTSPSPRDLSTSRMPSSA